MLERDEIISQNEVLEMARQAGFEGITSHEWVGYTNSLEAFAKLVAMRTLEGTYDEMIDIIRKDEREACAVTAEEHFCGCGRGSCPEEDVRAHEIAQAIRARGEA